jgi:cytochrome c oxidase subunit II
MRAPAANNVKVCCVALAIAGMACAASESASPTNIFAPVSTPAKSIYDLALLIFVVTGVIFVVVAGLLAYVSVKYRVRANDDGKEPLQVYGSDQLELAWTVIPVLIVIVLFMTSARIIHAVQDAGEPPGTVEVTVVGHQFWWEYRYPQYGFTTANEMHVPISDPTHPTPTFLQLLSADTDHSFWIPCLAGKTDLIPNHPNNTWIDPHETGVFLGQCAQYCGTQHGKMLLRVVVDSKADFDKWVQAQKQAPTQDASLSGDADEGRRVFNRTACINCHTITGSVANGHFGPDLTHLMARETIGSGAVPNNAQNLRAWIQNPATFKPGVLMPAMNLSDKELNAVTAYMQSLR